MATAIPRTPRRAIDPHDELVLELRSMARYERRRARLATSPEWRDAHLRMAVKLARQASEVEARAW